MKGTVITVDQAKKLAVVQTVFGQFSVFDLKSGEQLEKGDIVRGYLESMGKETIINESRNNTVRVVFKLTKATRVEANALVNP